MIIPKMIIIILIADFITGFFHFLLDQYGSPKSRFFKNAIKINLAHRHDPTRMIERSCWELTKDSWKLGIVKQNIERILGESSHASSSNRFYDIGSTGAIFIVIDPQQKDSWFPSKIVPKIAPCSGLIRKDEMLYEFNVEDVGQVPTLTIARIK